MNLFEKLAALQQEFKGAKSEYNAHGGFKYRSLEPMMKELKPLLNKHKVMVIFSDSLENCADTPHIVAHVKLINLEKPDEIIEVTSSAQEAAVQKGMQAAQISGSTSSYARKYALSGLLAVDENEDLDSKDQNQNSRVSKQGSFKASPNKPASPAQKKFLNELFTQSHPDEDVVEWIADQYGYIAKEMTSEQASHIIEELKG